MSLVNMVINRTTAGIFLQGSNLVTTVVIRIYIG